MRVKTAALLVAIVFLMLFASYFATFGWASLSIKENIMALQLESFDKKVAVGSDACFTLALESNLGRKIIADYTIKIGDTLVKQEKIDVGITQVLEACVPASALVSGDNRIEINIRNITTFFHVEVVDELSTITPEIRLEVIEEKLRIDVTNNPQNSYEPIEIFVNGSLDHKIYFSGGGHSSIETLELQNGSNEVIVKFLGEQKNISIEKEQGFEMNPIIGFLLIAILIGTFFILVFPTQPFLERVSFSILSFFATIMLVVLALDVLGLLSAFSFVSLIFVVTFALILLFRKNFSKSIEISKNFSLKLFLQKVSPLAILLVLVVIFASLFYHFLTPSYFSIFTSFYERQAGFIALSENIPLTDPFSFLGTKPFGYLSGYFFINAGISWLTGITTMQSFAVIALLSQTALLSLAVLFFRSLKITGKKSYLGAILLLLGVFVFSDLLFNIRHVVANSFLLASLVLLKRNQPVLSAGLLALGSFVQPPIFLMFIALSIIVVEWKKEWLNFLKATLIGAIALILLFVPTFLRSGLPTQAKPEIWGYLWSIPIYGLLLDFLSIFIFIAVFIIPLLILRKTRLDGFAKKAIVVLVLFMAVQLFISYRINVVNSIVLAILIAHVFPKRLLEIRFTEYTLGVLFAVILFAMAMLSVAFYPLHPTGTHAFNFVKENTSTEANFLVEPYLGHPFILVAQRKASADLAVEYASEEMINDSYRFLKEKDNEILKKYEIDFIVNRSIFLDEKPVGDNFYPEIIEFFDHDKIYANEIFFIHINRNK